MSVLTLEGVVKAGQIHLRNGEKLPEDATVYVVVPGGVAEEREIYPVTIPAKPRIASPRLVRKEDAPRFHMTMTEDADAGV